MKKNTKTTNMTNKKRKFKKISLIIIAIILVIFLIFIASDYIIMDNNKKINLVINNKNVTSNLKNDVLIEDNVIYLSKADISNFFDKYIYNEEKSNQIITTY